MGAPTVVEGTPSELACTPGGTGHPEGAGVMEAPEGPATPGEAAGGRGGKSPPGAETGVAVTRLQGREQDRAKCPDSPQRRHLS